MAGDPTMKRKLHFDDTILPFSHVSPVHRRERSAYELAPRHHAASERFIGAGRASASKGMGMSLVKLSGFVALRQAAERQQRLMAVIAHVFLDHAEQSAGRRPVEIRWNVPCDRRDLAWQAGRTALLWRRCVSPR